MLRYGLLKGSPNFQESNNPNGPAICLYTILNFALSLDMPVIIKVLAPRSDCAVTCASVTHTEHLPSYIHALTYIAAANKARLQSQTVLSYFAEWVTFPAKVPPAHSNELTKFGWNKCNSLEENCKNFQIKNSCQFPGSRLFEVIFLSARHLITCGTRQY